MPVFYVDKGPNQRGGLQYRLCEFDHQGQKRWVGGGGVISDKMEIEAIYKFFTYNCYQTFMQA